MTKDWLSATACPCKHRNIETLSVRNNYITGYCVKCNVTKYFRINSRNTETKSFIRAWPGKEINYEKKQI